MKLCEIWLKKNNLWLPCYENLTDDEITNLTHTIQYKKDDEQYIINKAKYFLTHN